MRKWDYDQNGSLLIPVASVPSSSCWHSISKGKDSHIYIKSCTLMEQI